MPTNPANPARTPAMSDELINRLLVMAEWQDRTAVPPSGGNEPYYDSPLPDIPIAMLKQALAGHGARGCRFVATNLIRKEGVTRDEARNWLMRFAGAVLAIAEAERDERNEQGGKPQ
jgi:hypothetical protein